MHNLIRSAGYALLTLSICAGSALAKQPTAEIGKNVIKLEVAQTREQIEHGLMQRASMPEEQGMVFLFRPKREVRFWMFHCLMSLDMMFVLDGKIAKIAHDVPPCKSSNPQECPLYPTEGEVKASEVIEVNSGYCQRHGIKEGDTVKFNLPNGKAAATTSGDKAAEEPKKE